MFPSNRINNFFLSSLNLIRLELFFVFSYSIYLTLFSSYFQNLHIEKYIILTCDFLFLSTFLLSFFVPIIIKNVRHIANAVLLISISFVIYTTYINRFNIESFWLFIIFFSLFSFSLSSIKWFIRVNAIVLIEILVVLSLLEFDIDVSYPFFITTILLICVSGFFITTARSNYKKRIRKSEVKYRELADKSIFGVFILKDKKVVFANKRTLRLLRYSSFNEIVGLDSKRIIKSENYDALNYSGEQLKKEEEISSKELKLIKSDNELLDVEINQTLIDFEGEESILCSFIDISNRKKIELVKKKAKQAISEKDTLSIQLEENRIIQRRLQNSQSYSEGIIESSLDMIFTTDETGKIIKLNSAAKNQLRLNESDLKNESFDFILRDKKLKEKILEQLDKKNSFSGKVELLRKDKTYFPAFLSISHLYTTKGTFLGIMGVSRDISEVIAKEQEIKEQSSKLNAIIESSSHYFFSVNRNHRITSFNKLFTDDIRDKMGVHLELMDDFFILFSEEEYELKEFWKNKINIVFNGGYTEFEVARKLPNGKLYFREMFLNPIYGEDGKIEEVSGIGHDITEKKLYELELKKSIEEKEVLLKEVHHRVKNNLQVISSILNLQSTFTTDESMLLALKESQNRIRSMATIHERLYRTKNFSNLNFSEYVKDLSESILASYELSNISVELVFSLDEVFLSLNAAIPCGLIINELITNSLKYAFINRNKGLIRIDLQKIEEDVILTIADDGIGIPDLEKIKSSETLGLSLVSTLVEQIEGDLKIENRSGSMFKIKFNPGQKV